ncbi:oxidoreductase [Geothrix sp. 21YS21S-4]|uniref:oxidoreductase n=1 Tax=Geothrix sp. 21YS21S-4 TaxID=3068889 RepID=UPI0027BA3025|nr:oxidoreductase [Geothrix sp. 21YS21S-4]
MSAPGWNANAIPDQTGRVAVVTGATSGTGFQAALALAGRGARVILACRNASKAEEAIGRIRAVHPRAQVEVQALDLGSLASVRAAAAVIRARTERLDLLLNNAGVMIPPHGRTEDGFETQIGTNHFGHFALTGLLLEHLLATPGSRIVTMSSLAHRNGRIQADDLNFERGYRAWAAYSQSKLANLLFAFELHRRLEAAGISTLSVAAHPGWARTELQRHAGWIRWMRALGLEALLSQDAAGGALPLLRAATDPTVEGGVYYGPTGFQELKGAPAPVAPIALSRDRDLQAWLWRRSEESTGVAYPI